jgi:hypothetical protein
MHQNGFPAHELPASLMKNVARIIVHHSARSDWDRCVNTCCKLLRGLVEDAKRQGHGETLQ